MLSFLVAFHRRSFSQPLSCHWAISWSFTHCFSSLSLPAAASSSQDGTCSVKRQGRVLELHFDAAGGWVTCVTSGSCSGGSAAAEVHTGLANIESLDMIDTLAVHAGCNQTLIGDGSLECGCDCLAALGVCLAAHLGVVVEERRIPSESVLW